MEPNINEEFIIDLIGDFALVGAARFVKYVHFVKGFIKK